MEPASVDLSCKWFNLCREGSQHLVIREAHKAEDQRGTGLETLEMTANWDTLTPMGGKRKLRRVCLVEIQKSRCGKTNKLFEPFNKSVPLKS